MTPKSKITGPPGLVVAIIDDEPMVRDLVSAYFRRLKDVAEVLTFADPKSAFGPLVRRKLDVALVDLQLTGDSGLRCIRRLARQNRTRLVLAFTGNEDIRTIERALEHGAQGYLLKSEPLPLLEERIRKALAGEPALSSRAARSLIESYQKRSEGSEFAELTESERRVLSQAAEGLSCKQIAEALCLSINTVYLYNKRILKKLGVNNRFAAVERWRAHPP
jgi:DNA-binding NarL/FixJ family response regulator